VPAAAVIPAPIKNIEVVAVKKLVVGFLGVFTPPPRGETREAAWMAPIPSAELFLLARGGEGKPILHCEQIGVFKAGFTL